ncbi:MAG: biopolymer transporter ExbD [Candidatus Krumholzibacteriia bacterium]|nr:biopolymer transporter ExbD [Candidatus Latescibacterota bacterium]
MARRRRINPEGIAEANVTPLADVVTTLIVVFLMTMPALLWSGIQVNATRASKTREVTRKENSADDKLTVLVTAASIQVDGELVDLDGLAAIARERLAGSEDRTVIVVPEDDVLLGNVVSVMDVLKQNGAQGLALLNRVKGP